MINRLFFVIEAFINTLVVIMYNTIIRAISRILFNKRLCTNIPIDDYLNINSVKERDIQINKKDHELKEVVFSCYFINKPNPQTGEVLSVGSYEYMKPWYESVKKLNLNGIIIHDGIHEDFIKKYETDKIQFRQFTAGNYALIDERWFLYHLFISKTNIQKVFFTDINDIQITKNPFKIISEDNSLFIGRDNANKIGLSGWIQNEINTFKRDAGIDISRSFNFQALYNVGIVGGNRKVSLFVLSKVIDLIMLTKTETYKEMTVFNLVIHNYFFPILSFNTNDSIIVDPINDNSASHRYLVSGYPLNSEFKKFQLDSKATFIHK